jgi:hypothetical protein
MTMRDESTKNAADAVNATDSTADAVEQRLVAFAEQLGRVVGTVQGKAEGWMDRDALNAQIATVRDSAAELLEHLSGGKGKAPTGAKQQTSAAPTGGAAGQARRARKKSGAAKSAPARPSAGKGSAPARGAAQGRSGGVVDAPGKRHRAPTANESMPKRNDARLARMKAANANANRGRGRG